VASPIQAKAEETYPRIPSGEMLLDTINDGYKLGTNGDLIQ